MPGALAAQPFATTHCTFSMVIVPHVKCTPWSRGSLHRRQCLQSALHPYSAQKLFSMALWVPEELFNLSVFH